MRRTLLLAPVLVALAPAAAHAGTLTAEGDGLRYVAAPGETNGVFVTRAFGEPQGTVTLSDLGADVSGTPSGCTADEGAVTCSGVTGTIRLDLGDGDDSSGSPSGDVLANRIEVHGGPGNDKLKAPERGLVATALFGDDGTDTLVGGDGADELHGGAGADALDGYGGADRLLGEDGDDTLDGDSSKAAAPDLLDGGAGTDRVAGWTGPGADDHPPVRITVDGVADDGRPGEGDDVRGVERITSNVSGTFAFSDAPDQVDVYANLDSGASTIATAGGADAVRGSNSDETIDAGAGDDRVEGGYGNDVITPGPGRDVVYADKAASDCGLFESCSLPQGNDRVDVRDGAVDTVSCGVGTDTVTADPGDVVAGDCEEVRRGGAAPTDDRPVPGTGDGAARAARCSVTATRRGRTVVVAGAVRAPGGTPPAGARVTVRLLAAGRTVATAHARTDRRGRFTARLPGQGRRSLLVRVAVPATRTTRATTASARVR